VGRRQSQLDSAVPTIGDRATGVRCDFSSLADLEALYQRIGREHGHVDVLVANAALAEPALLGAITEEHFDKTFQRQCQRRPLHRAASPATALQQGIGDPHQLH
jgi:NAD(P)-dependent dehydrogenase (short-subunit alcohol dehydrogenase family)